MKKAEFISSLEKKLCGLEDCEVREHLNFYSELIDDRIEEGLSEEEAVAAAGPVHKIAAEIISEIPLVRLVKERLTPKRRICAWEIVLIILGSPLWISLAAAAFAVVVSLYASLWSVIISLWAAFLAIAVCSPAGLLSGIITVFTGETLSGITLISIGLILAGVAIYSFIGCLYATKGASRLSKISFAGIKKLFIK